MRDKRLLQGWEIDFLILCYPIFTAKEIGNYLNRHRSYINNIANKYNIIKKKELKVGQKFGKITLKECAGSNDRGRIWKCNCECNPDKEFIMTVQKLLSGNRKSCGCGRIEAISRGYGDITGILYGSIKRNADYRKIPWHLTIEFLDKLYKKQNGLCALSKIPLKIEKGRWEKGKITASLDRIDSRKPYCEDNVQWVHVDINYMKQGYSQEHFIKLCKLIVENN